MQFLLVGYYGYDNTGDDICLMKSSEIIRSQYPQSKIYYVHPNVVSDDQINRWNVYELLRSINKVDGVVFGGGGLLQDTTSSKSLWYYLSIIIGANCLGTTVYFMGQGVGPLNGALARAWVRLLCRKNINASFRSQRSIEYIGCEGMSVSSDLAYFKAPVYKNYDRDSNRVVINICSGIFSGLVKHIAKQLTEKGFFFEGIGFSGHHDELLLNESGIDKESIYRCSASTFYDPSKTGYGLMITMRYHSCVWASLQGIPFIALAYDEKVADLAHELGQPVIHVDTEKAMSDAFFIAFDSFYNTRDRHHEQLLLMRRQLIQRADVHPSVVS